MQRVELLCNGSPTSNHLEFQMAQVLVQEGDRDILRPHVGRVPWPRNLPERQKSPRLLLLNPEDIDLDMPRFGNALVQDNSDGCASVHPDAGPHVPQPKSESNVRMPNASADAHTTAYSSDSPEDLVMTAWVLSKPLSSALQWQPSHRTRTYGKYGIPPSWRRSARPRCQQGFANHTS